MRARNEAEAGRKGEPIVNLLLQINMTDIKTSPPPWRWIKDNDHPTDWLYAHLEDNQGDHVMTNDGSINQENAKVIEAAPLLLKGCCRAYNYLMKNWPTDGVIAQPVQQYRTILEKGIAQAGLDPEEVRKFEY